MPSEPIGGVHHIAYRVGDLETISSFYERVFQVELERRLGSRGELRAIWFRVGSTIVMLEPRGDAEPRPRADDLTANLFEITPKSRAGWVNHLAAEGVALEGQTAYSVYFRDPEGRRLGLSHYPHPAPP